MTISKIKNLFFLFICFISIFSFSQVEEPVTWETEARKISDTEYELIYKATIEEGWHFYSQVPADPDGMGPIATEFTFIDQEGNYELVGKTSETESKKVFEAAFDMDVSYFENEAVFKQKIKLTNTTLEEVKSEVYFQVCDEEKCLPPDSYEFNTNLPKSLEPVKWNTETKKISDIEYELIYKATIDEGWHFYSQVPADPNGIEGPIATEFTFLENEGNYELIGKTSESKTKSVFETAFDMDVSYFENEAVFKQKIKLINKKLEVINTEVYFQVCNERECLPPDSYDLQSNFSNKKNINDDNELSKDDIAKLEALILDLKGKDDYEEQSIEKQSYFSIFLLSFIGGLLALLTPCVFPMIPLTVSFFIKQSKTKSSGIKNAIFYGLSIVIIYVILGSVVTAIFGSSALNELSTNIWFNLIFFALLVVFAISFFGYFEITLPSSWANKVDSQADRGGLIGIFFMALALAIVSFSCTGLIVGGLLVEAASQGGLAPIIGMLGFSLAIGIPFALFAAFPAWLQSLPKSGGWLNTVKVVLGFIELAFALKFLSNADLVEHWGILKREVFIGLWIIISIGLALYLFGKIKFPHDSPNQKLSKGRISLGLLTLAFVIYLIPGLTNTKYANLKLLSGIAPPLNYSIYDKEEELTIVKDLNEGIELAKSLNKPIMLDFTGWACVNCRKMEEHVWTESKVQELLVDEFVIISLYVDDRALLEKQEQFKYRRPSGTIKKVKTIGDKWSILQSVNFKNNSQPYYVLLSPDLDYLNKKEIAYEPNADIYYNWLQQSLEKFKSLQKDNNQFQFSN